MIFLEPPADYRPKLRVVACYLELDARFLLLHRQPWNPEGGTWCIPGGKAQSDEALLAAILREGCEETGVELEDARMRYCRTLYVRYAKFDFDYSLFSYRFTYEPIIRLNPNEHQAYRWVTPAEALALPLIQDEDASLKIHFGMA